VKKKIYYQDPKYFFVATFLIDFLKNHAMKGRETTSKDKRGTMTTALYDSGPID
jgi:hypothetical protein